LQNSRRSAVASFVILRNAPDPDMACPMQLGPRMNQKALDLQQRTQTFAAAVIKFCESLPDAPACRQIVDQLTDAAGATDSNYRATCRARSPDEFIAKIGVAAEEADESKGWLELLVRSGFTTQDRARALVQEADELVSIFVASRKTAQRHKLERETQRKQMLDARRSRK
jgi:four helix bundle protein